MLQRKRVYDWIVEWAADEQRARCFDHEGELSLPFGLFHLGYLRMRQALRQEHVKGRDYLQVVDVEAVVNDQYNLNGAIEMWEHYLLCLPHVHMASFVRHSLKGQWWIMESADQVIAWFRMGGCTNPGEAGVQLRYTNVEARYAREGNLEALNLAKATALARVVEFSALLAKTGEDKIHAIRDRLTARPTPYAGELVTVLRTLESDVYGEDRAAQRSSDEEEHAWRRAGHMEGARRQVAAARAGNETALLMILCYVDSATAGLIQGDVYDAFVELGIGPDEWRIF